MTTTGPDYARLKAELEWLKANPEFEERPATIAEFLGPAYLNVEGKVRDAIRDSLTDIFGDTVTSDFIAQFALAMITGGIGIGKTTFSSIALPYLAHWVLCLKDPQDFFGLLPGSRIAFMQMSTSEKQALEVVFGDVKARIEHSPWFSSKYPHDPAFKNQIRFPKDVWIIPGDSAETTFEGYNILGGILDEADSHKITDKKNYAEQGYDTIANRISSRFARVKRPTKRNARGEPVEWTERAYGFLMVIGQMKSASGFAAKIFKEFSERPDAYAKRMAIWESLGWSRFTHADGTRDSFWYDSKRRQIIPTALSAVVTNANLIEIPNAYRRDFENNPEKALKDLAGIPPAVGDPFISLVHKIEACRDRWNEHHPGLGSPARPDGTFEDWFVALESLKRVGHLDIAYSAQGDALAFAMGHVRELVEIEDDGFTELKPYIVFDLLLRVKAPAGGEIFLGEIRRIIYHLKQERRFRLKYVSMDGFESTDTRQQLSKRRIETEEVSVDKQILPYHDLREAIYEDRVEFPPYMVYLNRGDTEQVEIAVKELTELVDNGKKIDHPDHGSKDVADAMAGVTYKLMGDRSYRKKVVHMDAWRHDRAAAVGDAPFRHPAYTGGAGLMAPVPPTTTGRFLR